MKKLCTILLSLITISAMASESLKSFIDQAVQLEQSNKISDSAELMEEAVKLYPESPLSNAYFGYYKGRQAGQTENYIQAGEWINIAFKHLDKAVELNPDCFEAHLFRGIIGVNVPTFFGQLDKGIQDLEWVIHLDEAELKQVPQKQIMTAYHMLVHGYQQNNEPEKAAVIQKKLEALSPSQSQTSAPQSNEEQVSISNFKEKEYTQQSLKDANALRKAGDYPKASKLLKNFIQQNPKNLNAMMLLIQIFNEWANIGYGASIQNNTNERAQIALDVVYWMDKAVELDPGNNSLRLERNALGIGLPFFVGKLEKSIEDLESMLTANLSDEEKPETLYWLGRGYQKKYLKIWNKAVSDYPKSEITKEIKQAMHPPVQKVYLANIDKPTVVIDFVLGFQDQLAPQTALWVEDEKGNYIKTLYVSGFSGHVKNKQVVLPQWAQATQFKNVDSVTAASIEWGEHIYTWDLKDNNNQYVPKGKYHICLEVTNWPSNLHQKSELIINTKKSGTKIIGEASDCISYWDATYIK